MDMEKEKGIHNFPPLPASSEYTPSHSQRDPPSIQDLTDDCARYASRRRTGPVEQDPCYELLHRACAESPDQAAWQAVIEQYWQLIMHWLGQYASEDTAQEVFFRFWKAQQNATTPFADRFPNTSSVMGFIKKSAMHIRIEIYRKEKLRQILQERLENAAQAELILIRNRSERWDADDDLKQLVLTRLKDERERVVFDATYRRGLPPREIQAEHPDLFPDTRTVHRVKENLLKRLGRDPALEAWWRGEDPEGDGVKLNDGGKTPSRAI